MAKGKWITTKNGIHVFIKDGETIEQAMARQFDDEYDEEIDENGSDVYEEKNNNDKKVIEMIKQGKNNNEIKKYLESLGEENFDWYEADAYIDSLRDKNEEEDKDVDWWKKDSDPVDYKQLKYNKYMDGADSSVKQVLDQINKWDKSMQENMLGRLESDLSNYYKGNEGQNQLWGGNIDKTEAYYNILADELGYNKNKIEDLRKQTTQELPTYYKKQNNTNKSQNNEIDYDENTIALHKQMHGNFGNLFNKLYNSDYDTLEEALSYMEKLNLNSEDTEHALKQIDYAFGLSKEKMDELKKKYVKPEPWKQSQNDDKEFLKYDFSNIDSDNETWNNFKNELKNNGIELRMAGDNLYLNGSMAKFRQVLKKIGYPLTNIKKPTKEDKKNFNED